MALIISLYRRSLWRDCRADKSNDIPYVTTRFSDVNFHLNFSMNLPRDTLLRKSHFNRYTYAASVISWLVIKKLENVFLIYFSSRSQAACIIRTSYEKLKFVSSLFYYCFIVFILLLLLYNNIEGFFIFRSKYEIFTDKEIRKSC